YSSVFHRPLHSFPTRRSSDLSSLPVIVYVIAELLDKLWHLPGVRGICLLPLISTVDGRKLPAKAWTPSSASLCSPRIVDTRRARSEEHTSELQSRVDLVCRLL